MFPIKKQFWSDALINCFLPPPLEGLRLLKAEVDKKKPLDVIKT